MYDVSAWNGHPGGQIIFTHAGQDATDPYVAFHGKDSYQKMLQSFEIGEIETNKTAKFTAFEKDYRELYAKMQAEGLFEAR